MRRLALVCLLALFTLPAAAQPSPAGTCSFTGAWLERGGYITTIDDQRHWTTYGDAQAFRSEGPPAGQGWVLQSEQAITFDWEGAEDGYEYDWRFSESCGVLDLELVRVGGEPTEMQLHIHYTRLD